ncbi:MAG: hypothetical protein RL153_2675, partial [Verrucomicrobiota bacterium]
MLSVKPAHASVHPEVLAVPNQIVKPPTALNGANPGRTSN